MADDIQSNIRINVDTASAMDSIRLLQNQISAFHTQMAKMGAASAADSRNLQQNLINSINSTGAFTANMTRIRTTAEQFSHSLEKNKLTMGEYFRYAGGASKTFGKLFKSEFETINKVARERVKDLQSQYIKLGRDANGAMQAIKVRPLALDMQNLGTKTQIAAQRQQLLNQLLKQGSTNLLNFGKNTQWAGRQLMVGFTIPLSIMGGAAMKAYQQIEEASIKLKRVYGDLGTTTAETNKMVEQVKQLALEYTKYGVAVKDSMDMAASAAATGKKGADLIAQVNSATKLSVLGGVDQQKALQTTISLTNAFNISSKDLAKNINFLNAVENQTVLNIDDMTTAIPKAAPVIQQLGGDVKDLAFFLTAMKEGGVNASEGANALKSGLASLINPTNTASKMLAGFGINIKGIIEKDKGDLKKTVVDFASALDTLDPLNRARAIEQLFGKFQFARMSTLFKNVIAQGSQASEVMKLAGQSNLELAMLSQKELNKIQESPLYKFQKAIADFQAQLAPVGEQFMKAITPLINFGTDVLKNFNSLGDGVKGFIVKFVSIAGVVGPVLLMSFGLIANAVANVIKGFALMKDIFNKTGKSSLSLGEQVNYMTQEQINAAAIASSLDQVHSKLKQTFTSEAAAVDMLTAAYERSVAAQRGFAIPITPRGPIRKYATGGFISGPGTGTSDSIPAMLSNGEAVIPAKSVAQNKDLVQSLINNSFPRFAAGGIIGTPSETLMQQVKGTSAVIAYGAHQPFTSAHQGIAQTGMSMAEQSGIPFFQFTSNQGKAKRSVLGDELKSRMIAEAIGRNPEFAKNPFELMSILSKAGIKNVNILLGEDRMKSPVWDAAAKEFGITITKTGIPRPAGSPSGTMARAAAASGNLGMFESLLASGLSKSTKNEIFKSLFTAGNAKIRKFSDGGMISGPGTGTSDSILAKVSNGEAIIPANSVARNPYLVRQLISGNIPGFAKGGVFDDPFDLSTKIGLTRRDVMGRPGADPQTAQIHARDAIEAGHTLKSEFKTAEQFLTDIETSMRDMGYSQANINKALKEANKKFDEQKTFLRQQGKTEQEIADYKFQTYGERTVLQPGPVNNKGTGYFSASEVKNFYKPGIEGSFAFANLVPHLKSMKFTDKEIEQILSNMATNLHTGLSKIDDATQMTLEDLDRLTNTAIDDAVKNDAKAKAAIAKIDNANYTFKTAKAGDNSRLAVGESYKGKQGKRIEQLEQITGQTSPYQTGGRTIFTRGTFEAAGAQYSPRATQQALRQLQIAGGKFEAEANLLIRQYAEKGAAFIPELFRRIEKQLSTIGLTSLPEIEATIARNVGTISTSMVHGLEQGFVNGNKDALAIASPSKKTQALGVQTGQGTVIGIESTIGEAAVAGEMVGKAVATGARRVTSEGPWITPGESQAQQVQKTRGGRVATQGESFLPGQMIVVNPNDVAATENTVKSVGKVASGYKKSSIPIPYDTAKMSFVEKQGLKLKYGQGFQGKMFGTSMGLGMASMFLPGEAGQIAGTASMVTGFAGMFKSAGPKIGDILLKFGKPFVKMIPYIGAAVVAYEAFDKVIVPLIRKNADAFNAISDTLNITKDKIKGINDFFGTDIKATGIRNTTIASGGQTATQASAAQQFQQSEQFKNIYQESAQKLKDLTDADFKRAMQFMATDLFGQGMEKEQVKAIIDAIAIEAKKSSVSIAPELFSLDNPETKSLMSKNINSVLTSAAKTAKELQGQFNASGTGTLLEAGSGKLDNFWTAPMLSNAEDIAKFKAGMSEIGSYMSSLSGQFANGTISGKEFQLQYQTLINITNSKMGTSGVDALKSAFISLNAEIGNALALLSASQFTTVSRAILSGVAPTEESISVFNFGTEKQKAKQTSLYEEAYQKQLALNAKINEQKSKIKSIQKSNVDIANTEQKINDKYDKRIGQIEKIKRLNDQIAKSQQGQLSLAEALNRGDISAAAKAAVDVQNNDIQTALDNQQSGLQDAKKAETDSLKGAQQDNTAAIQKLTDKIDNLNSIEVTVKNATSKVLTDPNILGKNIFGEDVRKNWFTDFVNWMSDNPLSWLGVTSATGGHIKGPGTGTSDSIPAMLSNGEYVIRANAVKTIGVNTLDKLNQADRLGFASGGMVAHFKNGGKAHPGAWSTANITQESLDRAERNRLYKQGGFQGFEAGFNSWARDLMSDKSPTGAPLKAVGEAFNTPVGKLLTGILSLPSNLIGGGVRGAMNTGRAIAKGDFLGAATAGFRATGDAFASSFGSYFNGTQYKDGKPVNNEYKSQWEVAAQEVIDRGEFGSKNNKELQALARIIGGGLDVFGDPLTYAGLGLASKAAKVGSVASKAGKSVVNVGRTVKDFARTKIAVMNAKKVLGIMGGPDAAKLTPQIGLKMRHEGLENFISDNAYKTIHNDVRSSAGDSISNRIAIEDATGMRRALGLNSEQSPAYGFLGSREAVPNTSLTVYPSQPGGLTPEELEAGNFLRQINPNSRALQTYGSASISLKESALKNATVSFGDTLSIWEQATKAGIKVPKVVRLDSLLTTLKLNSLAKKTKGILGNDFRMPYAEVHLPAGFGLDDVREVGVSNEFPNRVPELADGIRTLLSEEGYKNIGVHDIISRGNAAFRSSGAKIPTPHKYSDLIKLPVARYKSKAKQYTDTLLQKANKKFVKPIIKPFRDVKTLLLAKQYARKIGEVPHVSDLDIYSAQIQYRMFMDKMNLGKGNTVGAMGVDTHPSEIANQLGISENDLDDDIFAYISGNIKNKMKLSEVGSFSGVIREHQAPTSSYLNNFVRETTYTADDIYLSLNQKFRGNGIAQKFTTQYIELLKKAGIKKINIDAGMTDGGYAWARAGFRFTERPDSLIERMEMAAKVVDDPKFLDLLHRLHTAPIEDLPLPKEILKLKTNWRKYASEEQIKEGAKEVLDRSGSAMSSNFKINLNTKSLGELLLRGSNWKGSKDLISPSFVEKVKPMLTSAGSVGKSLLEKTKYLTNYKLPYAVKETAGKVGSLPSLFAGKFNKAPQKIMNKFMEAKQAKENRQVESVFNEVVKRMKSERGEEFTPEELHYFGVLETVKAELARKQAFDKVIKNPAIITRRSVESVIDMLRTNKTKTLFDTGHSRGSNDVSLRKHLENEYLGMGPDSDGLIYGYLVEKGLLKRPLLRPKKPTKVDGGTDFYTPFSLMTDHYGPVGIVLKNSSLRNATLTKGDSLNSYLSLNQSTRDIKAIPYKGTKTQNPFDPFNASRVEMKLPEYMEAQFPKYSPRKDIEALYVENKKHRDAIKEVVKELGLKIPVRIHNKKPIFQDFFKTIKNARKEKIRKREEQEEFDSYTRPPEVAGATGGLLKNGKFHYATGGMVRKYATGGFVLPTPEPAPTQYANGGMVKAAIGGMLLNGKFFGGFSRGGMVPSYLAQGGFAMGTDTVPAMLTPGEFVIKKSAVDRIGASALSKINGYADGGLVDGMSAASGDSVYNSNTYEINVNVSSNSNPNDIANAVMRQIKQVDNGRVRGLNR